MLFSYNVSTDTEETQQNKTNAEKHNMTMALKATPSKKNPTLYKTRTQTRKLQL